MDRHLVIAGPMGVGKTTLADRLGRRLGVAVRDSDRDIEALTGRSGRDLAATDGVDALHRLEAAILLGALAGPDPTVVAAAGWAIEDPWCREALARRARVVVLDLPLGELATRAASGDHRRPIDPEEMAAIGRRRRPLYDEVAELWLPAAEDPDRLVAEVITTLGLEPAGAG
jgi:shikimate kinase